MLDQYDVPLHILKQMREYQEKLMKESLYDEPHIRRTEICDRVPETIEQAGSMEWNISEGGE